MLKRILPQEEDFFKLFRDSADHLAEVAKHYLAMVQDLENCYEHAQKISEYEYKADKVTESAIEKLHKTFITPFDRYDIHRFVRKLDDTTHAISRTTQRITIYQLRKLPLELISMAEIAVHSTEVIREAVRYLHFLKHS